MAGKRRLTARSSPGHTSPITVGRFPGTEGRPFCRAAIYFGRAAIYFGRAAIYFGRAAI
jgi:hypothetical protein